MIRSRCPKCGVALESERKLAGQQDACPDCGAVFTVPAAPDRGPLVLVAIISASVAAAITAVVALLMMGGPSDEPASETASATMPRSSAQPVETPGDRSTQSPAATGPAERTAPPIAPLDDYFGRWVSQDGALRIAVTIRQSGRATVDYQDNGDDPKGFVFTNPYQYDAKVGIVLLKAGSATLQPDGSLRLVCNDPPLNVDCILPAVTEHSHAEIAAVTPAPVVAQPQRPALPAPVTIQPSVPAAPDPQPIKSPELAQLEDKIKRVPVEYLAVYREASAILKREDKDGSFTYSPQRNRPDLEISLPAPAPDDVMPLIDSRLRGFTAGEVPYELRGVWCGRGDKPGATAVHAGEVWKRAMAKVFGGGATTDTNSGRK